MDVLMIVKAFLCGGAICAVCQIFIDKTKLTPARILVSLVCIGAVLGLLGVYEPLVKFAGAGATVPLLGFGYSMFKGVKEAIAAEGFLGVLTGGFTAGAAGIAAAIILGIIAAIISKPKIKQ